jgi:hypothetical protein
MEGALLVFQGRYWYSKDEAYQTSASGLLKAGKEEVSRRLARKKYLHAHLAEASSEPREHGNQRQRQGRSKE